MKSREEDAAAMAKAVTSFEKKTKVKLYTHTCVHIHVCMVSKEK